MEIAKRRTVYDALQERLRFIFKNYDYIYVSFSGGKDSGVLLNACIDYIRKHNLRHKLGVFHLDYEVQYGKTTEYVDQVLASNRDLLEVYRVCVPVKVLSSTSMYQQYWRPWDPDMQKFWVRSLPKECHTVSDFDFYNRRMWDYEFQYDFASWLRNRKKAGSVACLVGIRTQESFNRWRTIHRPQGVARKNDPQWRHRIAEGIDNIYPLYDWLTTDIWTANGRFGWEYNRLYDLYWQAGVPLESQRVASPFISQAISGLRLYRAIDPDMWGKMLCRVNGVNFAGLYGGTTAMGWRRVKLPEGMTWKSYLYFLLDTLPKTTRNNYLKKLEVSMNFWKNRGGCLLPETIRKLREKGIEVHIAGKSNYRTKKIPVRMDYHDDIDLPEFRELPTYKRMCICILKNDHCCKYMGFSPNKINKELRFNALQEYAAHTGDGNT